MMGHTCHACHANTHRCPSKPFQLACANVCCWGRERALAFFGGFSSLTPPTTNTSTHTSPSEPFQLACVRSVLTIVRHTMHAHSCTMHMYACVHTPTRPRCSAGSALHMHLIYRYINKYEYEYNMNEYACMHSAFILLPVLVVVLEVHERAPVARLVCD